MCGRFYLSPVGPAETYIDEANQRLIQMNIHESVATGEVFPANVLPVIANSRKLTPSTFPMRWGYELRGKPNLLINARSETAMQKELFQLSFLQRRCLIPMDFYYEWEHRNGKATQKYAIRPQNKEQNYLAGLYRIEQGEKLPRCVILTREPSSEIRFIHNRMPVLISESNKELWLSHSTDPVKALDMSEQAVKYAEAT